MDEKYEPKLAELMLKFLDLGFPVSKLKFATKFKRGVNINGTKYFLPKDNIIIMARLVNVLETVYDSDGDTIIHVLKKYYDFKI